MKRPLPATTILCALLACAACAQNVYWSPLFDGKTLNGWQANESPDSWAVEDGAIVTKGPRSHLFYHGEVLGHNFKNFEFSAEVMTSPGSNSGIYIHTKLAPDPWPVTGYECQVFNSARPRAKPGEYVERKMTGSIYAVRNTWKAYARDNEWFEYRIRVQGRTIETFINGELVCQYTEGTDDWRADDKRGRRLSSGTIALQAHDPGSTVRFRKLRIRPLPDNAPSLESPLADRELDELIGRMSDGNFAMIDIGVVRDSSEQESAQLAAARRLGVTLGFTLPSATLDITTIGRRGPVLVVSDRDQPPSVALLKAAKANGTRVVFSSGGVPRLDPERLKARLQAIREAGLSWQDLWAP